MPTIYGLDFPLNNTAGSDVRLEWTGAAYLPRNTHTAIWKYRPVQQTGYYAVVWHARSDDTWGASQYEFGTHPYPAANGIVGTSGAATNPTGSSGTVHYWEIAGLLGGDYLSSPDMIGGDLGTLVVKDEWYWQARQTEVVNVSGTDYVRHRFWPDIENNPSLVIEQDYALSGLGSPPSMKFVIGGSPWRKDYPSSGQNDETPGGVVRHILLYDAVLTLSEIQAKLALTSDDTTDPDVWYSNLNPRPTDVSDKSGQGHNPTFANANLPAEFSDFVGSGLTSLFSALDETSSDRADYIKATAVDAVCVMDGAPALEEPPAGTNLLIEYDTKLQGASALQVELLEGSTVIKTASLPNGLGSFAVTPAEWGAVASWPWTPRIRVTSKPGTPPPAEAPEYVASALTVQKEGEGTTNFSATLASDATAGRTLLSFVGVRTLIFAGPVTGNNGNSHTLQDSQAFPSPWTAYSARSYRSYNVSGGSAHSVSGSKSSGATEELTIALLALDGGSIVDSATSTVAANGAGATLTSPTVTTTGPALLVCIASGTGDVNATAPTQTWPGNWTVRQSVAYSSAQAPDGHVPLYLATREVASAGDYSVDVQVTINEGLLFMIYAVSFDAFDDFSQTSGSTQSLANYSSRWAVLEGGFEVRSGVGRVEGTTASYNTARWTAGTFNADQYSIATVEYAAGVIFCGPAVRCQSGANTSYHCETDGEGTVYVSKCLAGSQSTLATRSQNFDSGDRLKLEVSGVGATVTLRVYRATAAAPNSFTQLGADITDSSSPITTAGSPGIFAYTNSSLAGISAWEGGNL